MSPDQEKNRKDNNLRYSLTNKWLIAIIIYFFVLLIGGISGAIIILSNLNEYLKYNMLLYTVLCAFSITVAFCSVQYLRRVYKACIESRIDYIIKENNEKYKLYGTVIYFLLRPIFALAFVLIAIFGLLGGFVLITSSMDYILNDKFFYFSVAVSSMIGYSVGHLIDVFETYSRKKISEKLNIPQEENKNETK